MPTILSHKQATNQSQTMATATYLVGHLGLTIAFGMCLKLKWYIEGPYTAARKWFVDHDGCVVNAAW